MLTTLLIASALVFDTLNAKEYDLTITNALVYFNAKCVPDTNQFNHLKFMALLSALKLTEDSLNDTSVQINSNDLNFVYKNKRFAVDKFTQMILKSKSEFRNCYIKNCLEMIKAYYMYETLEKTTIDSVASYFGILSLKEYSKFKIDLQRD